MKAIFSIVAFIWICTAWIMSARIWLDRLKAARKLPGSAAAAIAKVTEMRTTALRLDVGKPDSKSYFGGLPDAPIEGVRGGQPATLELLLQIDLADVNAAGGPDWLPDTGSLRLYWDPEADDFADQTKVCFQPQPEPIVGPIDQDGRRPIALSPVVSFPSLLWIDAPARLDRDHAEVVAELQAVGLEPHEEPMHRIGGFPGEIQASCLRRDCELAARRRLPGESARMRGRGIEDASWDWRLLLQVDSDEELGLGFGDCGRLYVFIREADARAADFSRIVTLTEWY